MKKDGYNDKKGILMLLKYCHRFVNGGCNYKENCTTICCASIPFRSLFQVMILCDVVSVLSLKGGSEICSE
jgi:hypothetical protein